MKTDLNPTVKQPKRHRRSAWKLVGLSTVAALALILSACTPSLQKAEIDVVTRANINLGYGGAPNGVNCGDFQLQNGVFTGLCGVVGSEGYAVASTYGTNTGEVTVTHGGDLKKFGCAIVKTPQDKWLAWPESCGRR